MTRLGLLLCAALLIPCTSLCQTPQPAPPPVAPDRSEMASDCLIAGEFSGIDAFCATVERLLGAISEAPEPGMMKRVLGKGMGTPAMAGVALDRPLRFYYMNPKLHAQPWIYQVAVADAEALKQATGATQPAPEGHPAGAMAYPIGQTNDTGVENGDPRAESALGQRAPPAYLLIRDGTATIYFSASACASLLRWQEEHAAPPQWRVPGQLRCRLAVQHILSAYGDEFAQEVQAMRDRMREALERHGAQPETEESIHSAQGQLDTASSLLKQVKDIDAGLELSETAAVLRADALPLAGSPLLKLVQAHPRGSLELLSVCPAGTDILFAQNVSVAGTASGLLLNRLGLPGVGRAIGSAAATRTLFGLTLPKGPQGALSAIFIRTNQTAETASQFWNRLVQEGAESAFALRPAEAPAGETAQFAEVTVNEAQLGVERTRAIRRIIGERPMAAQELRDGRSVLAFGATPFATLAQVRALEQDPAASLLRYGAFTRASALLPDEPNILLYASPAAVAAWLGLAEIPAIAPGAHSPGCAAACSLRPDGRVQAGIVLPLDQLLKPETPPPPAE